MSIRQLTEDLFNTLHLDPVDTVINFLGPQIGYLGTYAVAVATGTLAPLTALATGMIMSVTDLLLGFMTTGSQPKDHRSFQSGSMGHISRTIVPLIFYSTCGVPMTAMIPYIAIAHIAREAVSYYAATKR